MKKMLSILLSTLLCASIVVFSPVRPSFMDNNKESNDQLTMEIPNLYIDNRGDDNF